MMRIIPAYGVMAALFVANSAHAIGISDLQHAISVQQKVTKAAAERAAKAKREQEKKEKAAAEQRRLELKAKQDAAKRKQEEEQQRIEDLQDIAKLKVESEKMVQRAAERTIQLAETNGELKALRERLAAMEAGFNYERELRASEKKEFELERDLAEAKAEDAWKWTLGFVVTTFTAVVGGAVAVADIRHKNAEIRKMKAAVL